MSSVAHALEVSDVRRIARRRLPRAIFDVIEGGAGDELTMASNRTDLDAIKLLPRTLEDTTDIDLTTTLLGQRVSMPIVLAPCSFGRMCDPAAERAVARAAGKAGAAYVMPGAASEPVEAVAKESTGPLWYQIYLAPDDAVNDDMLARVKDSGYQALFVSVDSPMKPYRVRDLRNGINLPLTMTPKVLLTGMSRPRWAARFVFRDRSAGFTLTGGYRAYYNFEAAMATLRPVTLKDIERLRDTWDGPLVVNVILIVDKVRDLVSIGVDGVSVSNHGGRNLDGSSSAIAALPRIADTAAGDLEVFVDGGIRHGIDAIRALALGATACLVGRPYMYGLAAGGEAGVSRVLELLRDELHIAMAFTGNRSIADVDSRVLADPALAPAQRSKRS